MITHKSRAFIIEAADYRETSALLQLLCEDEGRVSLVSRGFRSTSPRKVGAPDPFSLVQVTYGLREGATLGSLRSIEVERVFSCLRQRIETYAVASYWFEILRFGTERGFSGGVLFQLTLGMLDSLERGTGISVEACSCFSALLSVLGFGVEFGPCVECGDIRTVHLDIERGATLCAQCAQPTGKYFPVPELNRDGLARLMMARAQAGDVTSPKQVDMQLFWPLMNELFQHHLERRMKSYSFLMSALGLRA